MPPRASWCSSDCSDEVVGATTLLAVESLAGSGVGRRQLGGCRHRLRRGWGVIATGSLPRVLRAQHPWPPAISIRSISALSATTRGRRRLHPRECEDLLICPAAHGTSHRLAQWATTYGRIPHTRGSTRVHQPSVSGSGAGPRSRACSRAPRPFPRAVGARDRRAPASVGVFL